MDMTKKKLEEIYNNNTNDKVCEMLGISKATLIKYLNDYNIKLKGKGAKKKIRIING